MEHDQTITLEARRESIATATPPAKKSDLGQYFTPWTIASFMAGMFEPLAGKNVHLLDPGAGVGSLAAAFAVRACADGASSLDIEAWEIDPALEVPLSETLAEIRASSPIAVRAGVQPWDFVIEASAEVEGQFPHRFTHAILNPPYKKLRTVSDHRKALKAAGIETANYYSAFVALAILLLEEGGEIVAITPRSFCNGTYFKPFRRLMLETCAVKRFHVFESRTHAFKGDEVLQENVIFHLKKGGQQGSVTVSTSSDATFGDVRERDVPFDEFVLPGDVESIFHLVADEDGTHADRAARFTNSLEDLGLAVATGPVVDFRLKAHMTDDGAEQGAVPLVYAWHAESGFCAHPKPGAKKPNFIRENEETRKWLLPSGWYVLVRRMSSKEEKRRIVPTVCDPGKLDHPADLLGFENHLNVFHSGKKGLKPEIAKGLAVWLGSTAADEWLRRFNGHTQVNAGDLRALRYPDLKTLAEWGGKVGDVLPTQGEIDALVEGLSPALVGSCGDC
ncbi:MAG TPA: Eco57I restriction-modification methylase domain-containing protein [Rhodocyclaceae bacterium]|nr:Eco57I restriction-modification methylase domain-containing protein [Rhodocyclaceae bacterium]